MVYAMMVDHSAPYSTPLLNCGRPYITLPVAARRPDMYSSTGRRPISIGRSSICIDGDRDGAPRDAAPRAPFHSPQTSREATKATSIWVRPAILTQGNTSGKRYVCSFDIDPTFAIRMIPLWGSE